MQKAYSDSTKLRYLKQYLERDALDIVKNYHAGSELSIAYKALDDVYGTADMVIRECIKGIQKLPRLTSDHNTRANKTFLYKITTNLSTLRCYNFNVDKDEAENSTFMISIEEKLPHDTFLKWEDYKSELKTNKKKVTLDAFTTFFGEKIRKEENANFVRQKPDNDGKGGNNKTRVKMYQTTVKEKQKG